MLGYRFLKYNPKQQSNFDRLFDIFKQLLTYTSGDVAEALSWLTELDKEYKLTDENYGIGDFINDLRERGYIKEQQEGEGNFSITPKTEQSIRQSALELLTPAGDLRNPTGDTLSDVSIVQRVNWRLEWSSGERARLIEHATYPALLDAVAHGVPLGVFCVAGRALVQRVRAISTQGAQSGPEKMFLTFLATRVGLATAT